MDEEAQIVGALGVESAFGYHVEQAPHITFSVRDERDEHPAAWYPCLDDMGTYSGCLGDACPLRTCWTGQPAVSYLGALRRRFQPVDAEYLPGALCGHCCHVEEVLVTMIDARQELIRLPMLRCDQDCWIHPISTSSFVRRRIPAREGSNPARCSRFAPATTPIPSVEAHRLRVNRQARARRAARDEHDACNSP